MKTVALILLLLFSPLLSAHAATDAEAEPGKILARLQSEPPSEIAWGAYLAGMNEVRDAVPLLIDLLRPHPDRDSEEWNYVTWAVLDGLIRLDARVPDHLLLHHAKGKGWKPSIILLAREPEKNRDALLSIFRRARPGEISNVYVAIGNLLCDQRAPGFAAVLLGLIPFELHLTVTDPDATSYHGGSRRLGFGSGDGVVRLPEGFPPYARYLIWIGPRSGSTLLADGPHPVHYSRMEYESRGLATGIGRGRLRSRDCAIEWLGVLLDRKFAEDAFPKRASRTVRYHSAEQYIEAATTARDRLLGPWRELVEDCLRAKLLTGEEAKKLAPAIEVNLRDRRTDKSTPLPELPADRWKPSAPEEEK